MCSGFVSLTDIQLARSVTRIGVGSFQNCNKFDDNDIAYILESVTNLDMNVFLGCQSIKNVIIPNTLVEYDQSQFSGSGLETVTFEAGCTFIDQAAFSGCTNLKTISIPSSVETIYSFAFKECTALESIVIPTGVATIDSYVFEDCTNLSSITLPATITSIGTRTFDNINENAIIYVPNATIEAMVLEVVGDNYTVTIQ